jgi:hypothetical protein
MKSATVMLDTESGLTDCEGDSRRSLRWAWFNGLINGGSPEQSRLLYRRVRYEVSALVTWTDDRVVIPRWHPLAHRHPVSRARSNAHPARC